MNSNGGPLLLVPGEYLLEWEGIDTPSAGRQVEAKFRWDGPDAPATDYDRACDVKGYLGAIQIGEGTGLVLGDEPAMTSWQPLAVHDNAGNTRAGGMLIRWIYADSGEHVVDVLGHVPEGVWMEGVTFRAGQQPLYLIDSAFAGSELEGGDHLFIQLPAGTYRVSTAVYEPDASTCLVLHRLMPSE
jgi:hypothetical protein